MSPPRSRRPARPRTERIAAAAEPLRALPGQPDAEPEPADPIARRGAQLDAAYRVLDADLDRIWRDYNESQGAAWTLAQTRIDDAARHYAARVAMIREPTP